MPLIVTNTAPTTPVAITNGDFETGDMTGWTVDGSGLGINASISTVQKHGGTYSMVISSTEGGGGNQNGFRGAYQDLAVPAGKTFLSFWYRLGATGPAGGANGNDAQRLEIRSASDGVTKFAIPLNEHANDQVWKQLTVDLSQWAGTTIRIYFAVYNNTDGSNSWMYVDDVTAYQPTLVLAAATPGPAPTIGNDPTDVTGAMRYNSGADWTALEAQRAANPTSLWYEWKGEPPRYSTGSLVVADSVSAPAVGALITVSGTLQTIAPTSLVHHVTSGGGDTVSTITPPGAGFRGTIKLIAATATAFVAGGNIASAVTIAANTAHDFYFDGISWIP